MTPQRRTRLEVLDQTSRTLSTARSVTNFGTSRRAQQAMVSGGGEPLAPQHCRPGRPAVANHQIRHDAKVCTCEESTRAYAQSCFVLWGQQAPVQGPLNFFVAGR